MSIQGSSDPQQRFTRQSDVESTCNDCCSTIRADRYMPIEIAEDIHMDLCLLRPDLSIEYVP
jgi:hypothetical protein